MIANWRTKIFTHRRQRQPMFPNFRWLQSRFDSAVTTDSNARHWSAADGLSADAAVSPDVRRTLRNRARYEVANNSYARGIVLTLADNVIGTGPRLQMVTEDAEANRHMEAAFQQWAVVIWAIGCSLIVDTMC